MSPRSRSRRTMPRSSKALAPALQLEERLADLAARLAAAVSRGVLVERLACLRVGQTVARVAQGGELPRRPRQLGSRLVERVVAVVARRHSWSSRARRLGA